MSATTRFTDPTLPEPPALHLALELSNRSWKLAFSTGHGQKPRFRNIAARDLDALTREIALARKRFDLPDSVPVISCFEAGRDGFWIHRFLQTQPHCFNLVVDSASIEAPRLLMADGNAAIWGAVRQVWPEAGEQRCWNHKMRNVLDRLPQREQSEAKDLLRAVVYAPSRAAEAVKAREVFARRYRPWYPKAVDVLEDDWERMVAFYDFPEDHWKHLRTTNVVESPFAALRLRTTAAKRFKRVESATALIWKLLLVAEKRFRRLDAPHLLKDVFEGRKFEDGKPVSTQQRKNAA